MTIRKPPRFDSELLDLDWKCPETASRRIAYALFHHGIQTKKQALDFLSQPYRFDGFGANGLNRLREAFGQEVVQRSRCCTCGQTLPIREPPVDKLFTCRGCGENFKASNAFGVGGYFYCTQVCYLNKKRQERADRELRHQMEVRREAERLRQEAEEKANLWRSKWRICGGTIGPEVAFDSRESLDAFIAQIQPKGITILEPEVASS